MKAFSAEEEAFFVFGYLIRRLQEVLIVLLVFTVFIGHL
jgi:hypothetical protein